MPGKVGLMELRLFLFNRFDDPLGELAWGGRLTHAEEIGGEDTLEFECPDAPAKGDRLLWRDPDSGAWREHVVVRTDEPLRGACRVYAESSLSEMLLDFIEMAQLVSRTAEQALAAALAPTRWEAGTVEDGFGKHGCMLYHTNALAALRRIEEVWGCEAEPTVEVSGNRVSRRSVSLAARRGSWRGARLDYGRDLAGCTRRVLEDDVFTALYGFGCGLPIEDENGVATGGYTRRLTFGDANGGVNWVGDEQARLRWGRWDASRERKVHSFGQAIFPNCDDPHKLLSLTRKALADACSPKVTYEVDASALAGAPVELGDDVLVVDAEREPEWRFRARTVRRVREFEARGSVFRLLTLGAVERTSWAAAAELGARVDDVEQVAAATADAVQAVAETDLKELMF